MKPLLRVLRYFRPYRARVIKTLSFAVLTTVMAMVPPYLVKGVIDRAVPSGNIAVIALYVLGVGLCYFLRDYFNMMRIRINNLLEQQVILDMRDEVFRKMQSFSLGFYANRSTGELMSRVVDDVNHVERVLLDGTEQSIVAVLTLAGVTGFLFYINPTLAFLALIPIPFLAAAALWYTHRMRRLYRNSREKAADMNATLHDSLSGLLQVKIFGREQHQAESFYKKADAYRQSQLKVMFTWAFFHPATNFLGSLGGLFVLFSGGVLVTLGRASVGDLLAFFLYLNLFYEPINRLHSLNNLWQDALASSERVFEIMDTPVEIKDPDEPQTLPTPVQGEVRFENVSFAYTEGRPVLSGINLAVAPGETIALVGPTGAGKTTLVSLIPRFYDVSAGRVTVDGVDVRDLRLEDLRSQIAVVSQEPFLFNGTIRENLLFGQPDATDDQLMEACRMANAADFIQKMPDGLDSVVGERGVKLSVGQKQRISIARAILKQAKILILDEATSSVDTVTEMQIQEALERLMQGKTTFIIAHRLSTIRHADRIACIENGQIVELGTHQELVQSGGLYAMLCEHQAKGVLLPLTNGNDRPLDLVTTGGEISV